MCEDCEKAVERGKSLFLEKYGALSGVWFSADFETTEADEDLYVETFLGKDVLVVSDGLVYSAELCYSCGEFYFEHDLTELENITHWMPYPEPPKST